MFIGSLKFSFDLRYDYDDDDDFRSVSYDDRETDDDVRRDVEAIDDGLDVAVAARDNVAEDDSDEDDNDGGSRRRRRRNRTRSGSRRRTSGRDRDTIDL